MMKRRLKKELSEFHYPYTLHHDTILVYNYISKVKTYPIQFTFPLDYPFKSPSVKVCEKIFPFFYDSTEIFEYYHRLKKNCICCNNILCPVNWSPSLKLSQLRNIIVKLIDDLETIESFRNILVDFYSEEIIFTILSFHV